MIYADSREYDKAKKNYLPSGIMNYIRGNIANLCDSTKTKISKLGNWMAMHLTNQYKIILCITMYRIPQSSIQDIYNSIAQYNKINAKMKNATQYWREIINKIADYVVSLEHVDDIILAGDLNQAVGSLEIQQFYNRIGIVDVHHKVNNIDINQLDPT